MTPPCLPPQISDSGRRWWGRGVALHRYSPWSVPELVRRVGHYLTRRAMRYMPMIYNTTARTGGGRWTGVQAGEPHSRRSPHQRSRDVQWRGSKCIRWSPTGSRHLWAHSDRYCSKRLGWLQWRQRCLPRWRPQR